MAAKILALIVAVLEVISTFILAAMMVLTFVDVLGRYVLGSPIFGASEMISTMLALIIFLGLGIANARDTHIVVELFDHRVRGLSPRIYEIVVQGFSILTMCLIVFVLYEQAVDAAAQNARTIVLEWPLAWITGTITALAALSVVSQILGLIVGKPRVPHLEDL
jgi:TRAP-type C4-dicarboxylate transport system permease small subunit